MTADVNPENAVPETVPPSPNPRLVPPRAAWIEFLLHFSTSGLYTSYWFVRRVQEFKRIYATDSRPWLWLFVPFIILAQLIALPKFVSLLNRFERDSGVSEWRAWFGAWHVLIILLTLCFNLSGRYEFPGWFLVVGLSCWAALFTTIHCRINKAKQHQTLYEFEIKHRAMAIPEILILLIMLPITLTLCFISAKDALLGNTLEKLESGSLYQNEDHLFKLPIVGDGWRSVALGTRSSGGSYLELQGPLSGMYFIVFSHGVDETVSGIAYARQNEIMNETPASRCRHLKVLNSKGDGVIAKITCTSTLLANPVLETVTVVETSAGIVEMYGYLMSVTNTFKDHQANFEKMAAELEPL